MTKRDELIALGGIGVKVRELEWPPRCPRGQRVHNRPALVNYTVAHYGGDVGDAIYRWAEEHSPWSDPLPTYEAAKAAAQADYETRILKRVALRRLGRLLLIILFITYLIPSILVFSIEMTVGPVAPALAALRATEWSTSEAGLDAALTAPGATTKSDGGDLDVRFQRLEKEATDLGYVLTPEPEHPDSPHKPSSTRSEVTALADIAAERERQRGVEGWSSVHDDGHDTGEMAGAAACYALSTIKHWAKDQVIKLIWPWADDWWKPKDARRNLVKAGALIVAEIERLVEARAALSASKVQR